LHTPNLRRCPRDHHRHVTLNHGTERAFTGATADGLPWDHKGKGVYVSAIGGWVCWAC